MNHDKAVDDLAHERFKSDFNKLFGAKPTLRRGLSAEAQRLFPTEALRKEYAESDEVGRILMRMEAALEKLAEPIRAERAAKLAKVQADNAELRKRLADTSSEILGVAALVDRIAGEAAARLPAKGAAGASKFTQLAADLTKSVNQILAGIQGGAELAKAATAATEGVSESADLPFANPVRFTIN